MKCKSKLASALGKKIFNKENKQKKKSNLSSTTLDFTGSSDFKWTFLLKSTHGLKQKAGPQLNGNRSS